MCDDFEISWKVAVHLIQAGHMITRLETLENRFNV